MYSVCRICVQSNVHYSPSVVMSLTHPDAALIAPISFVSDGPSLRAPDRSVGGGGCGELIEEDLSSLSPM